MKKGVSIVAVSLGMTLLLAGHGFGQQGGGKGKPPADDPSVTVSIDGVGVDTLPTYRIQSDQLGSYRNSAAMQSVIQPIGDWELDMLNFDGSGRTILVDLREVVPNSAPGGVNPVTPFAPQLVRGRFIAKCSTYGVHMNTMQAGWSSACPLAVRFDQGGLSYRINFNPENFPNLDPITVTCDAVDAASKCKQWTIVPSVTYPDPDNPRKSRAKLLRLASGKRDTDHDLGDFYMSFTIRVTKP